MAKNCNAIFFPQPEKLEQEGKIEQTLKRHFSEHQGIHTSTSFQP